jgi:transcriptional regulator with XRE-family HTH domain
MFNSVDLLVKNIHRLLKEYERKPAWLAEKAGIKPPNLSRLLKGDGNPTLETVDAIARAFVVESADLLAPFEKLDITSLRKRLFVLRMDLGIAHEDSSKYRLILAGAPSIDHSMPRELAEERLAKAQNYIPVLEDEIRRIEGFLNARESEELARSRPTELNKLHSLVDQLDIADVPRLIKSLEAFFVEKSKGNNSSGTGS